MSIALKRAVFNRSFRYLEKFNLFSEDQYGFQADKSTLDAAIVRLDLVYSNLDDYTIVVPFFLE